MRGTESSASMIRIMTASVIPPTKPDTAPYTVPTVIDVVVSDWLLRHDFPLPREGDRHIVEGDFAELISSVQRATDSGLMESEQGLQSLVQQPNDPTVRNWKPGGYLGSGGLTKDPWQNDYVYVYPGQHGEYDIYTLGADGQEGGEGINADRGNWLTE